MPEYPLVRKIDVDGREFMEEAGKCVDLARMLREYDSQLRLVRNHQVGMFEVWRRDSNGHDYIVWHERGDNPPALEPILQWIKDHDLSNGYDPFVEAAVAIEKRRADDAAAAREMGEASADRTHFELVDEFSAHMPAARPLFLGNSKAH